jgi:hypothetical protein
MRTLDNLVHSGLQSSDPQALLAVPASASFQTVALRAARGRYVDLYVAR